MCSAAAEIACLHGLNGLRRKRLCFARISVAVLYLWTEYSFFVGFLFIESFVMINWFKEYLKSITLFLLLLLGWHLVCKAELWSAYVLPSPQRVYNTFLVMLASGELLESLLVSLRRVVLGFAMAFVLSLSLSLVGLFMPRLRAYYMQLVDFVRHIPPLSLIPLLILWAGIGEAPKLIVIVLAAFAPLLLNIDAGLVGCDSKLIEVGKVLGFSEKKLFTKIIWPSALPHILVGMRISLGYALRAIIGAEMVAASSGLGYLILDAQAMSRTDKAMVGIFAIGVLGIGLDFLMKRLIQRLFPYLEDC